MRNVCQQVLGKYKAELQKDDHKEGKALVWVVVRGELGKFATYKLFECIPRQL